MTVFSKLSFRNFTPSYFCIALLVIATFICPFSAYAAVELDVAFGTDGLVSTDFGAGGMGDYVKSITIDSQDRLVAAGYCWNGSDMDFALARYKSDGTLDADFGINGLVSTDFRSSSDYGYAVEIDNQGRILVAGYCWTGSDYDSALARYKSDGTLDGTFGSDGLVITDFGSTNNRGYALAIDNQDRPVVAGQCYDGEAFGLARYKPDGTLDGAFGNSGLVSTDFGPGDDYVNSITIDSQDRLVVTGSCNDGEAFALARYKSDGILDGTFGSDGLVSTNLGSGKDVGYSIAIDGSGRLVVAGYCDNGEDLDFALARYTESGEFDPTFGTGGLVSTDFGLGGEIGHSIAIDSSGRHLVAGRCVNGNNQDFALARYMGSGDLDMSFGSGGLIRTDFWSGQNVGFSIAIDSSGRLVVAGFCESDTDRDFALARYGESFTIIPYWTSGGTITPGSTVVFQGYSQDFTISPDISHQIERVYVDGESISFEPVENKYTYTFDNISADHGLLAIFEPRNNDDVDDSTSDDITEEVENDIEASGSSGGGCNISALSGIGLLLAIPLVFLSGKMK